jgi:lambda repressor-like predicted transcriptional regulator
MAKKKEMKSREWYEIGKDWIQCQAVGMSLADFSKRYGYHPNTMKRQLRKHGFNTFTFGRKRPKTKSNW